MKSIFNINPDCKSWSVEKTSIPLKAEFGKEKLLKVTYGEGIVTEGTYSYNGITYNRSSDGIVTLVSGTSSEKFNSFDSAFI